MHVFFATRFLHFSTVCLQFLCPTFCGSFVIGSATNQTKHSQLRESLNSPSSDLVFFLSFQVAGVVAVAGVAVVVDVDAAVFVDAGVAVTVAAVVVSSVVVAVVGIVP